MIRWAQANALMPAVQFSIAPWDLSPAADMLVTKCLAQREASVETIVALSNAAVDTLAPICRPLWWLDATDAETFEIDDQFALGDDCIVAPVVHKGAVTRDVYLTRGRWRDAAHPATVHEGGAWLRGYAAPLDMLPIFHRVA
jgi:alpha-glucosidase (family GH31 glycosyl hydrolase)